MCCQVLLCPPPPACLLQLLAARSSTGTTWDDLWAGQLPAKNTDCWATIQAFTSISKWPEKSPISRGKVALQSWKVGRFSDNVTLTLFTEFSLCRSRVWHVTVMSYPELEFLRSITYWDSCTCSSHSRLPESHLQESLSVWVLYSFPQSKQGLHLINSSD